MRIHRFLLHKKKLALLKREVCLARVRHISQQSGLRIMYFWEDYFANHVFMNHANMIEFFVVGVLMKMMVELVRINDE